MDPVRGEPRGGATRPHHVEAGMPGERLCRTIVFCLTLAAGLAAREKPRTLAVRRFLFELPGAASDGPIGTKFPARG